MDWVGLIWSALRMLPMYAMQDFLVCLWERVVHPILMLANVIPTSVPRAPLARKPHEPRARLILEVPSPAYPLGIEQVHYC